VHRPFEIAEIIVYIKFFQQLFVIAFSYA